MRGLLLEKSSSAFRTISEVAAELDVPKHVLRFWEGKFQQLRPMKRGGGRRYYRPEDVELLRGIRWLLYSDGYTIKGVQRILREQGVKFVKDSWRDRGAAPKQAEPEASFPIPNLAEEAALAARRGKGAITPPDVAPTGRKKPRAAAKLPQVPELSAEHRATLASLLRELEECRDMLQPSEPRPKTGAARKGKPRQPALDA